MLTLVKRYQAILLIGLQDTNTPPDRIRYVGDPVSMLDFNSTTVMLSIGFRWKSSAHSYKGLQTADKAPLHDVERNPLTPSPEDSKAEVITEQFQIKQIASISYNKKQQQTTMPNYQEPGTYKIYSAINDGIHIGSTTLKFCERMRDHRTRHRTQAYTHLPLYKAFAEHGKDNFYIELIENALVMTRTRHTKKKANGP